MLETVGSDGSGLQYHVSILPKKVANDYHMTKEDSLWYCFGIACLLIKMVKDKAVMKTKCPFTGNCIVTSCHVLHPFVFIFHSRLSHFSQINCHSHISMHLSLFPTHFSLFPRTRRRVTYHYIKKKKHISISISLFLVLYMS
jgi:hypothetical protein